MSFSVELVAGPLSPLSNAVADWQRLPEVGATVTFTGQVRVTSHAGAQSGRTVTAIDLEHYPGMTERMLQALLEEARVRWALQAGEILHRIGHVPAGETIVRVSVACAHRREAFEAAAWLMDALKSRVPFWKREWVDGQPHWVEAKASDLQALDPH